MRPTTGMRSRSSSWITRGLNYDIADRNATRAGIAAMAGQGPPYSFGR
jgi:hypothetical protein